MGTWGIKISNNDTYADIYAQFFELYNTGEASIDAISRELIESNKELIADSDDSHNFWFALAQAQWECKNLDPNVFNKVRDIIESGENITLWKEEGVSDKDVKKRTAALSKFLASLSTERAKPKRRKRPKFEFHYDELIHLDSPDKSKYFNLGQSYISNKYESTSGGISYPDKGGAAFYYANPNITIKARWLDNNKIEIRHPKELTFSKKETSCIFVELIYIAE